MKPMENPARLKASAAYNAAADHFDEPPLAFWERHGRVTVSLLDLGPGDTVLDVGCGTGASAIPAAEAVGHTGYVIGVDVADNMLERARAKALSRDLAHTEFRLGDMSATGYTNETFDAAISVFSIFFVADIEGQVKELWRMIKPGGKLAVTVWCPGAFEPGASIFGEEVRRFRPDLTVAARPWERLTSEQKLWKLFEDVGIPRPEVYTASDAQLLRTPEDWWTVAMGSGYRWEIEQLSPVQREIVRTRMGERLKAMNASTMECSALCAIARKPI
ncbi:MAG: methyltransferase domain-containing protein [Pseudomonadota bacterium]